MNMAGWSGQHGGNGGAAGAAWCRRRTGGTDSSRSPTAGQPQPASSTLKRSTKRARSCSRAWLSRPLAAAWSTARTVHSRAATTDYGTHHHPRHADGTPRELSRKVLQRAQRGRRILRRGQDQARTRGARRTTGPRKSHRQPLTLTDAASSSTRDDSRDIDTVSARFAPRRLQSSWSSTSRRGDSGAGTGASVSGQAGTTTRHVPPSAQAVAARSIN